MTDAMCIMLAAAASIVFAILVFLTPEPGPSRFCAENEMATIEIVDGVASCFGITKGVYKFDNNGRRL